MCDVRLPQPGYFVMDLTMAGLGPMRPSTRPGAAFVRTVLTLGGDGRNVPCLQKA
jgi:hypothetical protein